MITLNISNLQVENKKEEYINYLLKKSVTPTKLLVSKYIKNEFENETLGTPKFKPFDIKYRETSNSAVWNKNIKNLSLDLNILYQSINIISNDLLSCEELYLNEKEKLINKILEIQLMIDNLNDNIKSPNNLYSYVQTFNDFYSCDLKGNLERNIPKTTSFIDLIHKNVKNKKEFTINNKINISNANISMSSNISPSNKIGELESVLNDTINDFYFVEYSRSNDASSFTVTITVNIPIAKNMNTILFECLSPFDFTANLKISKDNTVFEDVYSITSNNTFEWVFDTKYVNSFKITLSKKENDGTEDGSNLYYYIIKNIGCLIDEYISSSTFVSNEIEIPSIINNVTLHADEYIFPNTSIDYFIGVDNKVDPIEWQQIKNNEELNLKLFNDRNKILNNSLKEYGMYLDNGCSIIYKLPKNFSTNDLKLLYGYQMWKLETLDIPDGERMESYNLSINDYTDYYVLRNSLVDTEEYEFSIRNAKTHILTQYIYCESEFYINNRAIECTNLTGTEFTHKIYVNNYELSCVDNKYNFILRKGLNVVHVMLYVKATTSEEFSTIKHNINFKEYSFNVFASKPMKYINYKSLSYDNIKYNQTYYTIDNNYLIVKDDMSLINEHVHFPNLMSDLNFKNNSRYLLKYKELNEYKKNLVFEDDNKTVIRIMAILKTNNRSYSPQINSFRITSR